MRIPVWRKQVQSFEHRIDLRLRASQKDPAAPGMESLSPLLQAIGRIRGRINADRDKDVFIRVAWSQRLL
jgi:hypothetical protein